MGVLFTVIRTSSFKPI